MFCQKSLELVKDLKRAIESGGGGAAVVPPFDDDRLRTALEEMRILFAENKRDVDEVVRATQGARCIQSENATGVDEVDEDGTPHDLEDVSRRHPPLDHTTSFNATAGASTTISSRRSLNSTANATERHSNGVGSHRTSSELGAALMPSVHVRHAALERNRRCILAYLFNRLELLRRLRWEQGSSVLPEAVRSNLHTAELDWFSKYSTSLSTLMSTFGGRPDTEASNSAGRPFGLDLCAHSAPPKCVLVHCRCVRDAGELECGDGGVVTLSHGSEHLLPRRDAEPLIRLGVLVPLTS